MQISIRHSQTPYDPKYEIQKRFSEFAQLYYSLDSNDTRHLFAQFPVAPMLGMSLDEVELSMRYVPLFMFDIIQC